MKNRNRYGTFFLAVPETSRLLKCNIVSFPKYDSRSDLRTLRTVNSDNVVLMLKNEGKTITSTHICSLVLGKY